MGQPSENRVRYSVVLLLEERNGDFWDFLGGLHEVFLPRKDLFEMMVIANGTGGFVRETFPRGAKFADDLRILEFSRKTSQAVCLKSALAECTGEIFVICGSYQQISRASLEKMLDSLAGEDDMLCPWRRHRVDPLLNQWQSRAFNSMVSRVTGTEVNDLSCTLRLIRRQVLEETEMYGDMYRFLPVLASRRGFRTREVECEHSQERGKSGLYSLRDYIGRLMDILALYFTTSFARKPLRFFGARGMLFFLLGVSVMMGIFLMKWTADEPIGGSPLLILSIISMVVGVQFWSIGLLGEILAFTHGRHKKEYVIKQVL